MKACTWVWVAALFALWGCKEQVCGGGCVDAGADSGADGDADSDADADVDADADADADGDGDGDVQDVTFVLLDEWTDAPLAGAMLAADLPTGQRVEGTSGADGKVTVEGVDWSAGTLSVTYHLGGYQMLSRLGIDRSFVSETSRRDGAVPLSTFPIPVVPEVEMVTVTGTFVNKADRAHSVDVNLLRTYPPGVPKMPGFESAVGSEWIGRDNFRVEVPRGVPFTLQAFEITLGLLPSGHGEQMGIFGVVLMDFEALEEDLSDVVVDFGAGAVDTSTADIWFRLPARADSPIRDAFYSCNVQDLSSWWVFGWRTYVDLGEDGDHVDASILWSEPPWADRTFTACFTLPNPSYAAASNALMMGYPQTGEFEAFWDVPEWVVPEDPREARPLHDPLQWQLFETDYERLSLFVMDADRREVWTVMLPHDATTATLPQWPSSVDPEALFGSSVWELEAYLLLWNWDDANNLFPKRARSESVWLRP